MHKQVLLVDDSVDIHPLVKALLGDEPVDVHSAMDPACGLTLARSLMPDLILLDVDMPGFDGYEFCRRLKADPSVAVNQLPVLFLSAKGNAEQRVQGLDLGAVDYVTKPFSPGELRARVAAALRTRSQIVDLEGRSLTDGLTALGNGKMFFERLRGAVSERSRAPKPLACVYVDVDGFGQINRLYGPPFGDGVLLRVADTLRATFRPEDVACRMGDDDFAILLPSTSVDEARALASDFKTRLARATFVHRGARVPITCGVGIAAATDPCDQSVLRRAGDALEQPPLRAVDAMAVWADSCEPIASLAA